MEDQAGASDPPVLSGWKLPVLNSAVLRVPGDLRQPPAYLCTERLWLKPDRILSSSQELGGTGCLDSPSVARCNTNTTQNLKKKQQKDEKPNRFFI